MLAGGFSAAYLACVTVVFRCARPDMLRAAFMVRLFLASALVGIGAHLLTPANLWFLPSQLAESRVAVDLVLFLFLYAATFFGGILQLYNLADRGFSLRIAIEIDKAPQGSTVDEIMTSYSDGRGIRWMYQKRLDDMVRLNLISMKGEVALATESGKRVAARFRALRQFLRVEG